MQYLRYTKNIFYLKFRFNWATYRLILHLNPSHPAQTLKHSSEFLQCTESLLTPLGLWYFPSQDTYSTLKTSSSLDSSISCEVVPKHGGLFSCLSFNTSCQATPLWESSPSSAWAPTTSTRPPRMPSSPAQMLILYARHLFPTTYWCSPHLIQAETPHPEPSLHGHPFILISDILSLSSSMDTELIPWSL